MAEFGAGGAGRRDEDRRALKEGKKLLKKALGAAGLASKEKLRREKQRRRDAEARAEAERRTTMAARRAELHQRAVAEAAERRRQADAKSRAEARARVARVTEALEAERAADRARATETERRCQATERALEGEREARRATEWEKEEAERERARWYEEAGQARSTAEAQRSRAEFYVTEAQRRDAAAAIASRQDDAHIDAARAEAAARTAAADASRRQAERERARAFTASVEMHQTRDRLINSKNHELRQQAERSNAYREEATRARDQKHALHERSRRAEARLKDMEAELRRVKEAAALKDAAAALGGAAQRSSVEETQRLKGQVAAWRNVAAAKEELEHATGVCRRLGNGDQWCIKRMHEAGRTYEAARAAAEASTQQDDSAAAASEEPLPVGTAVQLVGCAFNTSFNGRRGIIAEAPQDLIDRGRVAVNFDAYGGGGTLPFSRKNVVKWPPEQAAGGPAFAFGASSTAPPAPAPARGPAFTFGAAPPPAAPAAPVGDRGELAADLDKLDRAVSSLLASKNELKREVRNSVRRLPINNNGHSIVWAMDAVEKDFEGLRKIIQEVRARAHTTTTWNRAAMDAVFASSIRQSSRTEETTQRLQLQAAAWRNADAAWEEMTQVSSQARGFPPQLCGTAAADAMRKRQGDALDNLAAARAAAQASTQEDDGDPDLYTRALELYARLQSQHEQHNMHRRR